VDAGGTGVSAGVAFCVDAGGSTCRGRITAAAGAVLAQAQSGPCNPTTDLDRAAASLTDLWHACAAAAGRDAGDVGDVTFAIGGAGLLAPAIRRRFLAACPRFARTEVMTDGYAALIGAGGGRPCALIITGTGVVAHRLFPDGRSIIRDGWGWIGGDRGSGAWLGQKAIRHALAALDGVVPHDGLSRSVLAALRAHGSESGAWLVGVGPDRLATFAPLVLDAAAAGDPAATRLLARAAAHLAALAASLGVTADDALYMAGGLAPSLRPRVSGLLGRAVAAPADDAIAGCLLVATGAAPPEALIDRFTPATGLA
jgi:glucosamine kinase